MVKGILADINIQGHVGAMLHVWEGPYWGELWHDLALPIHSLADLGLPSTAPDLEVWHACQRLELILITANRNDEGPDSLESAIRNHDTETSLPVLTLADAERFRQSRTYAEQVAEKALEYMLDIQKHLGSGRLYIP